MSKSSSLAPYFTNLFIWTAKKPKSSTGHNRKNQPEKALQADHPHRNDGLLPQNQLLDVPVKGCKEQISGVEGDPQNEPLSRVVALAALGAEVASVADHYEAAD